MNCNDLTAEEAFGLWRQYKNDDGYEWNWEDQLLKSGILYSDSRHWVKVPIIYESDATLIKGSFRGFLYGGGWTIYVGNNYKGYWGRGSTNASNEWSGMWKDDGYNRFTVPRMRDVTKLICGSLSFFPYLNWVDENPWEVKE